MADRVQAGCAKALLGKAVLPDDLPWVTGTIGLLGTHASSDLMAHCDTLLMVGTNFPYAQFLPKAGQARGIQIDIYGGRTGIRYATELNLHGRRARHARGAAAAARAEDGYGVARADRARHQEGSRRQRVARGHHRRERRRQPRGRVLALDARLPDDVILTADAGTSTNWSARHLHMRRGMKWSLSGTLATMGGAVPYAIAAKFAFPDRPVVALIGDGAMQMNGINELITVAKYWQRWSDPRLVFFVANNRDLNQVTWEMRIESGVPKYPGSQDLPDFPYARYAELIGLRGVRVDRAEDLGAAWDEVLHADRPAVIEVMTDANISMLPPHIKPEQMKAFASAMLHGDPDEGPVLVQSVKGVLAGLFPGEHGHAEKADR